MSEKELVMQLKNKEIIAFDYLYNRYAPPLYGLILKIVPEKVLASKVLRKCFIEAWNRIELYNPSASTIFSWMVKIAIEQCGAVIKQPKKVLLKNLGWLNRPPEKLGIV